MGTLTLARSQKEQFTGTTPPFEQGWDGDRDLYRTLGYLEIPWLGEQEVEVFMEKKLARRNIQMAQNYFLSMFTISGILFGSSLMLFMGMIKVAHKNKNVAEVYSLELGLITILFLIICTLTIIYFPLYKKWHRKWLEAYHGEVPDKARSRLKEVQVLLPETQGYVVLLDNDFLFELEWKDQIAVIHHWQRNNVHGDIPLPK